MKKLLIAAAAMTAVAGVAQAQSVTIYGILDAGIYNAKGVNSSNQSASGLASGGMSTSRIGFTGSEDLGGGTKAVFKLESEVQPTNGTTSQDGRLFKREASVGLSSASVGTVLLGRMNTLAYSAATKFSALGATNNGDSFAQGYVSGVGGPTRLDNVLAYVSPSVAGFSVAGAYTSTASEAVAGNASATAETAGNTSANKAYNYELNYNASALAANIGYLRLNSATGPKTYDITYANASYDFGVAKLFANYFEKDLVGAAAKPKATSVGVSAPVTAKVKVAAQYTKVDHQGGVANNAGADGYGFLATYDLSKRTNLYAGYSQVNNDSGAAVSGWQGQSATATVGTGKDQKITTVGVRHSF